tara:strand:- start:555 stop:944 length:390 start_codon:yes stop_codon:yes gene_type:complete
MDLNEKTDYGMYHKDILQYYNTTIQTCITANALSMAVLSYTNTINIKKHKYIFFSLFLIAIIFLIISNYNNRLMRKILIKLKINNTELKKEIEKFIIISKIFHIIDGLLIISGLYILYNSVLKGKSSFK